MNRFSANGAVLCTLLLLFAHGVSRAGQVYGTVVGNDGPAQAVAIEIKCSGNVTVKRLTDEYGAYSVYVNAVGRCDVWANGVGPLSIRVYEDDVRYDLRLTESALTRD